MSDEVINVIKYFSFFSYLPNFEEIYNFYPKKITKDKLKKILSNLVCQKKIFFDKKAQRYTIGEYGIRRIKNQKPEIKNYPLNSLHWAANSKKRYEISKKKLSNSHFRFYIKLLSFFPQIKLIGLSGSIAMMNAKENDDIDLFIITGKNRLFTGRFIALILASILGIRRKRVDANQRFKLPVSLFADKVCLNLFFDESCLMVPDFKKTEFVAHEILQMKPIINKDNVYQSFIKKNSWVFDFFPNAKVYFPLKNHKKDLKKRKNSFLGFIFSLIGDIIEFFFKKLQLFIISHHQTTEIITSSQLWFHPDDFEKKIKNGKILK